MRKEGRRKEDRREEDNWEDKWGDRMEEGRQLVREEDSLGSEKGSFQFAELSDWFPKHRCYWKLDCSLGAG